MSLLGEVRSSINAIRRDLYGVDSSILILQVNGVDVPYNEILTVTDNFIASFDRTGNITFFLITNEFDALLRDATHMVFDGWLYEMTEPAKPSQGPFAMYKVTGRPTGNRYTPPEP